MMKRIFISGIVLMTMCFFGSFEIAVAVDANKTDKVTAQDESQQKSVAKNDSSLRITRVKYTAGNRRDPFVSIITLAKKKMQTMKKKKSNPLENYDVTDFRLLGVIYDGKKYYASVVLPDNKAYTLKKGMKVGIYGGRVEDITSDKLVVKETVVDFMGKKKSKYTEIKLRKEEVQ
ncbi:Pilus assembly protein, PilP [bacterium BMS3Abin07]|nr:Pilus assembly protein, PilP [bacterium BMS3Abin07]GBE32845.1 Pilus assembly protein, PilP [bacterium BMS3Bbin05]HDO22280.1 hypothetical protein [Nitrospirota bacterium]HDZ88573.1 hypothetical protein [Nitrospirota bacterium]